MWKNRIAYLILWISAFALYIFYVGYTSYFLFLLVTSLPCLSILYMIIGMRKLEVRLFVKQEVYTHEEKVHIHIYSRTRSIVPLARIQGTIEIENAFTQEKWKEPCVFTSEKNRSEITIPIRTEHCGKIQVRLSGVQVYDLLGILHVRKQMTSSLHFYVFPTPCTSAYELLPTNPQGEEAYDPNRPGNDPGETFDVHNYQPGDSLHKIHWKLSAKLDEYMVRDFSMPAQHHVIVAYELYGSVEDAEQILGYVYGFSKDLLRQRQTHKIQHYVQGGVLTGTVIAQEKDLFQYLKNVLATALSLDTQTSLPAYSKPEEAMFYVKKDGLQMWKKGEKHDG